MLTPQEKMAFAQRLRQALKRSPTKVVTPTELAVQFSLRHKGGQVTPQAAQKWLTGQSQPSPEKIETLAEWLDVSVRWLRFGIAEDRVAAKVGKISQKAKTAAMAPPLSMSCCCYREFER